jgi:hypothetical protein
MSTNKKEKKIETGVGPMTDQILNTLVEKINSDMFKSTITSKILDPLTASVNEKIKPYVQISMGLYGVVVILMIIIIYLLVTKK